VKSGVLAALSEMGFMLGDNEKNAEGHFLVARGVSVSLSNLRSSDYIL